MKRSEGHLRKGINPNFLKRGAQPTQSKRIDLIAKELLEGNATALSQGITLIESSNRKDYEPAQDLIERCLPNANNSIRIGITGVPGVGKSTFIEALGTHLTEHGKKVAVLAVDPTSTVSKGSILGDKTRMYRLSQNPNAFIRPSASGDSLGGVARKTREAIILCEAAGYTTVLIETVGVGQSETIVHSMVDFFLLLKLAGAGDELQGIKRGIIEMADAIVINKADGDNEKAARLARTAFSKALHLFPPKQSGWVPKVTTCSALKNTGVSETWDLIKEYTSKVKESNFFDTKRIEQNKYWLLQTIENKLKDDFYTNETVKSLLPHLLQQIKEGKVSPFAAAQQLIDAQ